MWRVLAGALGLIVLDVVVSPKGSSNAAGVLGFFGNAVQWVISPNVPGIPNLAAAKQTASTTTALAA